jgi:magnesium-transporting ATPase (P-type)
MAPPYPHLEGLSGWLILLGLALIFSPFLVISTIFRANLPFISSMGHRSVQSAHPILGVLVFSELIMNTVFIIALVILIILFFRRDHRFPNWTIVYYAGHAVLIALNHMAFTLAIPDSNLAAGRAAVVRAAIGACIWIPYLLLSRRVKVTFIR